MGNWQPMRGTWVLSASWQRFVLKLRVEEGLAFGIEGRKATFKKAWTANSRILTATGPQPIRRHFRKIEGHEGVFVCRGCRRLCCWCFGARPMRDATPVWFGRFAQRRTEWALF